MLKNLFALFNLGPPSSPAETIAEEQAIESGSAEGDPRTTVHAVDIQLEKASNLGRGAMDETHDRRSRRRLRRARSRRVDSGRPPAKFW
jgi:hypothetical protein